MLTPIEQYPYSVETKNDKILMYTKDSASHYAIQLQEEGKDVEVWHDGALQYRLNGIYQGKFF